MGPLSFSQVRIFSVDLGQGQEQLGRFPCQQQLVYSRGPHALVTSRLDTELGQTSCIIMSNVWRQLWQATMLVHVEHHDCT